MKLTSLLASLGLLGLSAAAPCKDAAASYPLEGYAKDNPLGAVTGGAGGATTTVSSFNALKTAVADNTARTVYVSGSIAMTGRISIGSNKSVIGVGSTAKLTGNGFNINTQSNVIVRNLYIGFVEGNDGITIQTSTRVWIDHNEFQSDISKGPDFYDGQVDIIRASDWVTVSWNYFHDHWKSSLMGNSDANRAQDFGKLHVTYHHNYWRNEGTRGPAGRFGHQHVYNNFYQDFLYQAIHSRSDNQVLVEGNVFRGNTPEALSTYGLVIPMDSPNTSPDGDYEIDGYANLGAANDFGSSKTNITKTGDFTKAPYSFTLTPLDQVQSVVMAGAGVGKI